MGSTTTRSDRSRFVRILALGIRVLGWICALFFALALGLEQTRYPERWIAHLLDTRLGPAVAGVHIGDIEFSWIRRTAIVHDLVLGGEQPDLSIARLEVRLDWNARGGVRIEQARADEARLRLSPSLVNGLQALLEAPGSTPTPQLPELIVHGLSLSVETPHDGSIPVGKLDLALIRDGQGKPRLTGRLAPAAGPPQGGTIFLEGALVGDDRLEVRGAARDLILSSEYLPPTGSFASLRSLAPQAHFDLEAHATWRLGRDVLPKGSIHLAFEDGRAILPWLEDPQARPVENIAVTLEVAFDPAHPKTLWDRSAWQARGGVRASWNGINFQGALLLGQAADRGRLAEGWVHIPELPIEENLLDAGAHAEWLEDLWAAIQPSGKAEVAVGVAIPRGWTPQEGWIDPVDRVVAVIAKGEASGAYVGWPATPGGPRNQGFPLEMTGLRGKVFYAHHGGRPLSEEVSIFDMVGRHGEDQARGRCSVRFSPHWKRRVEQRFLGPERFHLLVESDHITVSEDLRPAFEGLRGVEGCEELWSEYRPTRGGLSVRLELLRRADSLESTPLEMQTDLEIGFSDVAARWSGFPLPCEGINGKLHLSSEGLSGRAATGLQLTCATPAAEGPVHISGRSEYDSEGPEIGRWEVSIDGLDSGYPKLREIIALQEPRALAGIEAAGVSGRVDARVEVTQESATDQPQRRLEILPVTGAVSLRPTDLPLETRDLEGRLIATWSETDQSDISFGVLGRWREDRPVWVEGRFPPQGEGSLRVLGAGIDPLDPELVNAIQSTLEDADSSGGLPFDPAGLDGQGRVDFDFTLSVSPGTGEFEPTGLVAALRFDHLGISDQPPLRELRGEVHWDPREELWTASGLRAVFEETPVRLENARWRPLPDGGWEFKTLMAAEAIPLDRAHLGILLDEPTVGALMDDLHLTGHFDIESSDLSAVSDPHGNYGVRFGGQLSVRDLSVRIGVPVEVNFARGVRFELRVEEGRVRALARVRSFSGEVAGRLLDDARLQMTYIAPRLTIEALDGAFEGGRLRSLAGRGGSTFFAIDLAPPYPFILAGRMVQVEVGRLLRGVFNSSFANRGLLEASLQLRGDMQHLTGIRGGGSFELFDSALWAVPVFQAVLSRLGFPSAATFSNMTGHYRVADGVIAFPDLELRSNLLSLVGSGTIDFDGTLSHDLEVRYALLDQFGPLTRLLYQIQNSLLRISVRGDMARPEVVVRGLFSQFFSPPSNKQRLPLPSLADLPPRF